MRGLFVGDGIAQILHPAFQRDELALECLDLFLLFEDGLGELGELALEMGVANLEIDEAAFHGREAYPRREFVLNERPGRSNIGAEPALLLRQCDRLRRDGAPVGDKRPPGWRCRSPST